MSQTMSAFLTLDDLANRWRVKGKWVYSNHRRLGLPRLPIGGHLRFPLEGIEEWERRNVCNYPWLNDKD